MGFRTDLHQFLPAVLRLPLFYRMRKGADDHDSLSEWQLVFDAAWPVPGVREVADQLSGA
ncbi:hypothetical protein [Burkholderia sp. JP2-270]|uniref:hypothetical protein n=1 Tax=Burkholderia sp. JP2-270 TaxID=2217913 RepID=UPI0013A70042|nr:hypothetical protein [Burkholderia sp. JP2-270]